MRSVIEFLKFLWAYKNDPDFASKELQKHRMEICERCPHKKRTWSFKKKCGICHCNLNWKVRFKVAECADEPKRW